MVRALTNGEYVITGPTYTGQTACMGPSAVLDLGAAQLVLTSRTHEPWDLGVFESLGLDLRAARFVLVKSRMYCRPVFVPISSALVERDSPGVTSSDYGLFASPAPPAAAVSAGADGAAGLSRPGLNGGPLSCPWRLAGGVRPRPIAIREEGPWPRYGLFAYQRRQRPLYPLEPMAQQDYRAQA